MNRELLRTLESANEYTALILLLSAAANDTFYSELDLTEQEDDGTTDKLRQYSAYIDGMQYDPSHPEKNDWILRSIKRLTDIV